ncbi:SPW repeat domain-containing protein [Olivibacter domesticus]|uniref:SPW repeat-containing protein n=1 Tax=Olivibacter domesticus TaxID=407022 RepID=A0A1H7KH56_OLID1|nr:SPW repeat protein [Olivibacter domesticus]SEK85840.1 SPW repeat-containing protein [Olivibacter domesticus]
MLVKLLPRTLHALLDYMAALLLLIAPWVFHFNHERPAIALSILFGVTILVMSLLTNYEGGIRKTIPMDVHLYADVFGGAFLALSPWLLFFSETTYVFHLSMGLGLVLSGLLTKRESQRIYMPKPGDRHIYHG